LAKHSLAKKELTQNTIFVRTAIQIIEKLEREMFSKYDYFRAISPFLASDPQLKKLISNEKIVMIPPAVDMSRIPYSRNCANDVAYFGILEKFEGLETLIQSFARVLIQHPFVKLHIFGDGPLRQTLQEVAGELGIASSVIFYGNLPRDELFHHFNKFSIAVFPRFSGYGHIPIKIIEALAAGKAVIATMVNGIEDIFSSNEVLLVNPGDEEQLSQAIITGLREGGLRKKLSYHGLIRAKDFDSSKVYKELFNLLIIKRG
jgi:glycosyltransferase involved in cell wall biosynthesis